ncbi:MAG: hypothetical protein ACD_63C00221G0003 [uncultured bacterium]|nr:MAG: hypothetical protein ACD_63C00221G0003 [uncultured bacterium]
MSNPDFKESPLEKFRAIDKQSKTYNWGLITSAVIGAILFIVSLYLYGIFFPEEPITALVAMKIIFLIFLLFFTVFTTFALYHAFRFGFEGDLTIISAIIYLIIAAIMIVVSWNIIF